METQTVRIDRITHKKLKELSLISHQNLLDIMKEAINRYYREEFWSAVEQSYQKLKEDKELYNDDLEERKLWDITLMDGLEDD